MVPLLVTMPVKVSVPPQSAKTVPPGSTVTLPSIVAQPERVALLLISRLSAKEWTPPLRWNVAASVPSPTTKSWLLVTDVPLLVSSPPLKAITLLAPLVSTSWLTVTVPLLRMRLAGPADWPTDNWPLPEELVTNKLPPFTCKTLLLAGED